MANYTGSLSNIKTQSAIVARICYLANAVPTSQKVITTGQLWPLGVNQ